MHVKSIIIWVGQYLRKLVMSGKTDESDSPVKRIPFDFIAEKLCVVARSGRDVIGRVILAPNKYIIRFSPEDRALRKYVEPVLTEELKTVLASEMKKWRGKVQDQKCSIYIETDTALSQGEFYIDCLFIPDNPTAKKVKMYPMERKDLSRTHIPPPGSTEIQDGTLIQTLLNPAHLIQTDSEPARMVCTIKVFDKTGERTFVLPEGSYCIGRGKDADIQLDLNSAVISRRHVALKIDKSGVTVKMLGRNGGKINGEFVAQGVEWFANTGDKISIDVADITVLLDRESDTQDDCNAYRK